MLSIKSLVLLSAFIQNAISMSSSNVNLEGNGYTGVLIAINPSVEENENLIDSIKETWTSASHDLYTATDHMAYFKDVTILVPKSWDSVDRDPVSGNENYNQADVIIAPENPSYGNTPYTIQYGGCGKQGMYSHFTPEYFMNATAVTNYGPRGKVVVHEWAHYRWGIFDETSDEFPFYWDPRYDQYNGPEATRCPSSLYGEVRNIDSTNAQTRCDLEYLDEATNSYPSNCVFFPFENQYYHPNSSIMSYQFLDEVTTFCRDDDHFGEHNRHNIYAPNDHNRLCDLKSTWTVIMESDDFKDTTANHGIVDTTPTFNVVRPQDQRFVLVLDTSGSMGIGSPTRSYALRQAAYLFITEYAPKGSWVGIVDFDSSAKVLRYLTHLDSEQARENLALALPDDANGGTCIGCGIQAGIQVLEAFSDPAGGVLIVMTDGEGSGVADHYDEVLEKGIIVETVFIQLKNSNELLEELSDESGGTWYFTEDGEDIQQVFADIAEADNSETNSFQIQSTSFTLSRGETYSSTVLIDYTIGVGTVFAFTWSYGSSAPYSVITTPSGCSYTNNPGSSATRCSGGNIHTVSIDFQTIKFSIPGTAEVGKWMYSTSLASSSSQDIILSVTSTAASTNVEPIIVDSGMSETDVPDGSAVIVYAKVTQGYNPIMGANVSAKVTRPSPPHVSLELLDNGAGADIRKNDGIYSRYFVEYSGPGRYSVEVEVSHENSTAKSSESSGPTSRANYRPGTISDDGSVSMNPNGATASGNSNPSATMGVKSEDIGEFSRIVSSGAFSYSGTSSTPPDLPPSQVNDLKVRQNDVNDFSKGVVLEFTAPGGDEDQGRASRYEIRYTYDDPKPLTRNFTGASAIQESDVIQGNLSSPSLAGTLETFIVNTPSLPADKGSISLAVAIRAVDNAGNTGKASSPGTISFFITPLQKPCECEARVDCDGYSNGDHYILTNGCEPYFFHCTHGSAVKKDCPTDLFFNPALDVCDWSRNIPACADSKDATTTLNPKFASTTIAAHSTTEASGTDDCHGHVHGDNYILTGGCETYFYQCNHGTAVRKDCPAGLFFNPATDACDWSYNIPACGS